MQKHISNKDLVVVTHDGQFHADECVAIAALSFLFPGMNVLRTRDQAIIDTADLVIDVGAKSDGEKFFDHHQTGRAGARPNGVPYSSAGLSWKVYGWKVVQAVWQGVSRQASADARVFSLDLSAIADAVDEAFIQYVCASDNGHALSTPKYENVGTGYSFSAYIASMNAQEFMDQDGESMARFDWAVRTCREALTNATLAAVSKAMAWETVRSEIGTQGDGQNPVLVLERFAPWIEPVLVHGPCVLYTVFPTKEGTWMCQCVPDRLGSFGKRKALPTAWAGLRNEALAGVTGVEDAVFCHDGRWICGARSKEGAVDLAYLASMNREA